MWKDEVVDEVREARRKHAEQNGGDLRRIYEDLRRQESQSGRPVVHLPPRPPRSRRRAAAAG